MLDVRVDFTKMYKSMWMLLCIYYSFFTVWYGCHLSSGGCIIKNCRMKHFLLGIVFSTVASSWLSNADSPAAWVHSPPGPRRSSLGGGGAGCQSCWPGTMTSHSSWGALLTKLLASCETTKRKDIMKALSANQSNHCINIPVHVILPQINSIMCFLRKVMVKNC